MNFRNGGKLGSLELIFAKGAPKSAEHHLSRDFQVTELGKIEHSCSIKDDLAVLSEIKPDISRLLATIPFADIYKKAAVVFETEIISGKGMEGEDGADSADWKHYSVTGAVFLLEEREKDKDSRNG